MTSVVLSVGSNVGDRMMWLQSVVDGLDSVVAVSPVYETDAWGGVEQSPFLNAVVVADDPALDAHGWLSRAHELEDAAQRTRGQRWGPRTLDVDIVTCREADGEVMMHDEALVLPHPYAHVRAFVLVPWLAVESSATVTVEGRVVSVAQLLDAVDPAERAGVQMTELALRMPNGLVG
ncbi:MAG: 2-amino-4-hydroxy-6-hydroxymethyldihydropteridine diphosphokinase [Actinomycetia bacterium]|nr:2-amino-4-hydroxy-6-hydroxymethyldihydropteridine diphosphokinase [Actinomycetes bacterium]